MDKKKFKNMWKKLSKMTQKELNKFILEDEKDKGEEDGRKQMDKNNERGS